MTYQRSPRYPYDDETFADEIERIVTSADVPARPGLAQQVLDRVAEEIPTSPPRRFLSAVAALDVSASVRNFKQVVAVASGGSRIPTFVRYQAIAVVMLMVSVVGTAGVLGAAATISIAEIVAPAKRVADKAPKQPPAGASSDGAVVVSSSNAGDAASSAGQPSSPGRTANRGSRSARSAASDGPAPRITVGGSKAPVTVVKVKDKSKSKPGLAKKPAAAKVPPWAAKPAKPAEPKPAKTPKASKDPEKPAKPDKDEASQKHQ